MNINTDVVIVGTGASGLFCALNLPSSRHITLITKSDLESSDSFLAQGGICMLKNEEDYESYFNDTLKAGHYENNRTSVDIMIRSSRDIINDLISYGVDFQKDDNGFCFTREGGHSDKRILFHEDVTGKEITSKLLARVKTLPNVTMLEYTTMIDIITDDTNGCTGIIARNNSGETFSISASYTILACGGIGGLYTHSTNFPHLTGDALAISLKHGVELENIDYIQIHPTTFYSEKPGRRFLISESVRGEGAVLLNAHMERFTNELLPRDVLTSKIREQMKKDGKPFVWLSMAPIPKETIIKHFPNIYNYCLSEGYDVTKEPIPVVPAQHYFMGGVKVNSSSRTTLKRLYAIGETSCNGVHGANRLASNSLLEALVFAKRAAGEITDTYSAIDCDTVKSYNESDNQVLPDTETLCEEYKKAVLEEIELQKSKRTVKKDSEMR